MTITTKDIIRALKKHKNVLLYGPPGTGKSHLMQAVANHFASEPWHNASNVICIDTDEERTPFSEHAAPSIATRWVTFHQGYSYEDFIVGMRPVASGSGGFSIAPRPGVLLELIAEAKQSEGLLLIDEINRGNTSRIFGEFITLMENDKRLNEEGLTTDTTVTITLPYLASGETISVTTPSGLVEISREFTMPANIYTLASMNSVDKSISPMDTALRRRFHVINLAPTKQAIIEAVGLSELPSLPDTDSVDLTSKDIATLAVYLLLKLNRGIGLYLGSDFMIGQWYLSKISDMSTDDAKQSLCDSWLYRIVPQLIELFHGRDEQLIALLGSNLIVCNGSGLSLFEANADESEYGATSYLEIASPPPSLDRTIKFLSDFVASSGV